MVLLRTFRSEKENGDTTLVRFLILNPQSYPTILCPRWDQTGLGFEGRWVVGGRKEEGVDRGSREGVKNLVGRQHEELKHLREERFR